MQMNTERVVIGFSGPIANGKTTISSAPVDAILKRSKEDILYVQEGEYEIKVVISWTGFYCPAGNRCLFIDAKSSLG
jgi:uridine kinase